MKPWRFLLYACAINVVGGPAQAFELNGGVSLGGIVAGTKPRFAVSPHAGAAFRADGGLSFGVHDILSILPATSPHGAGVYNQLSAGVGYAWPDVDFRVGPSLSAYSIPACNAGNCIRVVGLSPGGRVEANVYFVESLGLSVWANLDWTGGSSAVLPGSVAAMVFAGPVLRWRSK